MINLCAFALVLSSVLIPVYAKDNNYTYSDNPFEIKNINARKKLNTYLKKKNQRGKAIFDNMELKNSELYASDTSDFSKLTQIADGNYDFEYLYTYKDENVSDVIAYDKTDSTYILLEEDLVNNTSTMTIDEETYLINENNSNLSLVTENGSELMFYEEILDEDYPDPLMPAEGEEVLNVDGETPTTYTTWKKIRRSIS